MEVPGGHGNKLWVLIFEMLGAALLIFTVNASAHATSFEDLGSPDAFAVGLALFAGICLFGDVSGAYFNPAVTLAVFIKEGKASNVGFMLMIWVAQIVGCILGVTIAAGTQHTLSDAGLEMPFPGIAHLCPPEVN